jgi:hypothetical protein
MIIERWTPELVEQLTKLWFSGLSASETAKELGNFFTRNAVIGKVNRLKLQRPINVGAKAARPRRPETVHNVLALAEKRRRILMANFKKPPICPERITVHHELKETQQIVDTWPLMIPFADTKDGDCRFICSPDRAPVMCCGRPQMSLYRAGVFTRSSYCPHHHAITHDKSRPINGAINAPRNAVRG